MRPNSNSKEWADNLQAYRSAHPLMKRGGVAGCWMGWPHSASSSLVRVWRGGDMARSMSGRCDAASSR